MPNSEGFTLRERQVVHRMAEKLWESHGHPGQPCEPGSKGLGSCALDEQARASLHDSDACPGCDHECLSCGAFVPQGGSACDTCRPMMERAAGEPS